MPLRLLAAGVSIKELPLLLTVVVAVVWLVSL
jgi:hypothetical protein